MNSYLKTIFIVLSYFFFLSSILVFGYNKGGADILFDGLLGISLILHALILFIIFIYHLVKKDLFRLSSFFNFLIVVLFFCFYLMFDLGNYINLFR